MTVTHYFVHADMATALAALPGYAVEDPATQAMIWRCDAVDAGFTVTLSDGSIDPNYHTNVGAPALDADLVATVGFIGARDDQGNLVAGIKPTSPTRVFA